MVGIKPDQIRLVREREIDICARSSLMRAVEPAGREIVAAKVSQASFTPLPRGELSHDPPGSSLLHVVG